MLIEKRSIVAINDVVSVKLVSGEEIVGKLIDQSDDVITLAKPVTISLQPVSDKQMGLSFLPVLGSVEPDVTLQIPTLAMAVRPVKTGKAVASSYIQTTTGLVMPGAGTGLLA
jgi:hypothetical protein